MQTHEVSTHIHGFPWLDGTPNMETLNFTRPRSNQCCKEFHQYICYSMETKIKS